MHYRVSIRLRGNDGHGHRDREREIHVARPVPDGPMQKTLQAYPKRATVLVGVCWASLQGDEECPRWGVKALAEASGVPMTWGKRGKARA